jgi:hypothetical protein
MTIAEATISSNQGLRALDTDLPFLASEAAVDLENILSGRGTQLAAIQCLAARLKNSIELSNSGGPPKALMDPATLTVLGEAVAQTAASATNVNDVLAEAAKIASDLSAPESSRKREELVRARDFCVALSKAAASYRRAIRDLRPPHPFRR